MHELPDVRAAGKWTWFDGLTRDLVLTFRALVRTKGFTAVAVLTLAIGIGANTVVFTVTNAVLFRGFPHVADNHRLAYISSGVGCCVSVADFADWRREASSFSGMALVHGIPAMVTSEGQPAEIVAATEVTANTFALVGQRPALGREFTADDERQGAPPVAIVRHSFWQRRFGGEPAVVGRSLRINGRDATIVGVMPPGFSFPQNQDIWIPLVPPADPRRDRRDNWFALGRLAPGKTLAQARDEMAAIGRRLGDLHPQTNQGRNLVPIVATFEEFFIGPRAGAIYRAMWGAVAFVLLIVCANLANLLLARSLVRGRDVSVHRALGAGRAQLIRRFLVESVMLSAAGGAVGWLIARYGVALYGQAANGFGTSEETFGVWFMDVLDYSMDYRAFLYLGAISVGTGIVFGIGPALRLTRADPAAWLRASGRAVTADAKTRRAAWLLVGVELALALVLTSGTGTLLRGFLPSYVADPGFDAARVSGALISLQYSGYSSDAARSTFFQRLVTRAGEIPGVTRATLASVLPGTTLRPRPFEVETAIYPDDQNRPMTGLVTVGDGYFAALGVDVREGREFSPTDAGSAMPVAVVNRRFADRYLGGDAIGRRVRIGSGRAFEAWRSIVGVASDVAQNRDLTAREPVLYVPERQRPAGEMWLIVRSGAGGAGPELASTLAPLLRAAVTDLDPDVPLAEGPVALDERLARNHQFKGIIATVFSLFSSVAVLLAALGLYAVMAQAVTERVHEIGIRTALGATARHVVAMILAQAARPVVLGLACGVGSSLALGQLLRASFAQVSPAEPGTLAGAALVLVAAAVVGSLVPARRALRVDPAIALRAAE